MTRMVPLAAMAIAAVLAGAGCSADTDEPQAARTSASSDPPTGSTTPSATTTPAAPTTTGEAPVLHGRLLYSDFDEATHTFRKTYVSAPDGTEVTEIPLPGPEGGGRWSHAGDEIAVMTLRADGRVGTAIISATGKVLRMLDIPHPSLNLVCTTWSPDDSRLACEGFNDDQPRLRGIYTVRASDGGDLVRVTRTPVGRADLPGDYAPDGASIVFKRDRDEAPGPLMLVPTTGGRPKLVRDGVGDPGRFSPDGRWILTSGQGRLLVVDRSGEVAHTIADEGHYLFGGVWAPDGRHIAYSSATGGPYADIYVAAPDGSDPWRVTATDANELALDWGRVAG